MSNLLASELGLGVGISSGANFLGCVLANEKMEIPMVTVFADDNKKYLSTDLSKALKDEEWMVSNKIELLGWEFA